MHPWSATIIINEDSRSSNEKHMTNGIAVSTFPCNLRIDTSSLPWTPLVLPLHHQFSICQRYVQRFCPQIHVWCFESGRSALCEALSLSAWNKNPWLPNGPQSWTGILSLNKKWNSEGTVVYEDWFQVIAFAGSGLLEIQPQKTKKTNKTCKNQSPSKPW